MKHNFKTTEILESINLLLTGNRYSDYDKAEIKNNYKIFTNKNIKMKKDEFDIDSIQSAKSDSGNSDTQDDNLLKPKINDQMAERIIIDAEKSLKNEKKDDEYTETLQLNNLEEEKFSETNQQETLILKDEFVNEELTEDNNIEENNLSDEFIIEGENNIKELENNFVYENEKLKTQSIDQDEKIKDLSILVDSFKTDKRYSDLNSKIELYQADNAALRKKIFDLANNETTIRLQLADLELSKNIDQDKNQNPEQVETPSNENLNSLNEEIVILKQENKQLNEELSKFKKEKYSYSKNIDEKIQFYREENAKIIIDKSDIQRKLENTKDQLLVNEKNKHELKLALDNLNQILSASNIETKTFNNNSEEPQQENKSKEKNSSKRKEKTYVRSGSKLDESSLDYLIKEIFSK